MTEDHREDIGKDFGYIQHFRHTYQKWLKQDGRHFVSFDLKSRQIVQFLMVPLAYTILPMKKVIKSIYILYQGLA